MIESSFNGATREGHDINLNRILAAARKRNLTLNEDKSVFCTQSLNILGYVIQNGEVKPDPERLKPLRELPLPTNMKSLKRIIGLFAYYSQWIPKFCDKIALLVRSRVFPLDKEAKNAFNNLELDIANSVVCSVDESVPFELETGAPDIALAGILNQGGRPVAFFSRTMRGSELTYLAVEKEACAIIESVRRWKHYLSGHHFTLTTDQKSVAYMFDKKHKGRIKNDKINRWRLELGCYSFDIRYRSGEKNIVPDSFTRVYCSTISTGSLTDLHDSLCHRGFTRMCAFVHSKNLPYSVDDFKRVTNSCRICRKCKPQYFRPTKAHLIKSTQPFERLNIDFKGPLPCSSPNKYILTIIDEFSRFTDNTNTN